MNKNFFKVLGYLVAFIAAGAVAVFIIFKTVSFDKTGKVPLLAGKSITESAELLNKRKLFLTIEDKEHSNEFAEGYVVRQSVEPGKTLSVGSEVGVFVSKGPELYSMPSFEGQPVEEAKLTLLNLGIKINKVTWVHSDIVEKGRVIAQRPLPGNIRRNEINFLVSLGPYAVSYRCPSFVNMTIDDARILAKELGITLVEKKHGSRVILQKPEAETIIKRGDKVEISLGRGWGMWF